MDTKQNKNTPFFRILFSRIPFSFSFFLDSSRRSNDCHHSIVLRDVSLPTSFSQVVDWQHGFFIEILKTFTSNASKEPLGCRTQKTKIRHCLWERIRNLTWNGKYGLECTRQPTGQFRSTMDLENHKKDLFQLPKLSDPTPKWKHKKVHEDCRARDL